MQFTSVVASVLLAGSAVAQTGSASMPMSSGSAGGGQVSVQVVKVGSADGMTNLFEPSEIQAAPGSMVQFQFWPKNHSVVQSTFDQPCMPIKQNMPNATGLFSGYMAVKPDSAMMPTYTIMINDTKPLWLYCSQAKHCQNGMVMAINAKKDGEKTFQAYKQLASAAAENLSPGQLPGLNGTAGSASPSGAASPSGGVGGGVGGGSAGGASGNAPPSPTNSAPAGGENAVAASSASSLIAGSSLALAGFISAFVAVVL